MIRLCHQCHQVRLRIHRALRVAVVLWLEALQSSSVSKVSVNQSICLYHFDFILYLFILLVKFCQSVSLWRCVPGVQQAQAASSPSPGHLTSRCTVAVKFSSHNIGLFTCFHLVFTVHFFHSFLHGTSAVGGFWKVFREYVSMAGREKGGELWSGCLGCLRYPTNDKMFGEMS